MNPPPASYGQAAVGMEEEKMKLAKIMSFETFAAQNGAAPNWGDPGLHNPAGHMSPKTWHRLVDRQAKKDQALAERRSQLRAEFAELVKAGHIIEPTFEDRLISAAAFDGPRGEAAKRILARIKARKAEKDIPHDHAE